MTGQNTVSNLFGSPHIRPIASSLLIYPPVCPHVVPNFTGMTRAVMSRETASQIGGKLQLSHLLYGGDSDAQLILFLSVRR